MLKRKPDAEGLACNPEFRQWIENPTPESMAHWEKWIRESPENAKLAQEAKLLVFAFQAGYVPFTQNDENTLWNKIQNTIQHGTVDLSDAPLPTQVQRHSIRRTDTLFRWASVAAILILSLGFLWFLTKNEERSPEITQAPPPVKTVKKEVTKGQKLRMFLPDGSKVVLNSLSSITYPSEFTSSVREVAVEGEVYFEVKRDSLAPFRVKTGGLITEVLGTSFNVRAYPETRDIKVSLISGKVAVRSALNDSEISIDPGEEVKMDIETGIMTKEKVKYPNELQWMDGVLAFNNEPLEQVFKKLELWYGVEFYTNAIPRGKVVTGKFENEYLDNVLQSIQYAVSFDFRIDSNEVFVKF